MNRAFLYAVFLLPGLVQADATNDAFSAGAAFGQGNAAQGINSLGNAGAIPGYTSNPPEAGYYGGVSGGDGDLAGKAIIGLGKNNAGQAIIDSGTKNPMPTIDPDAPYITIGKNAEGNAGSIVDGTNSQCTTTTVSKSTFENFTCSADTAVQRTCARDTVATGAYRDVVKQKVITVPTSSWYTQLINNEVIFNFPLPAGAELLSGTLTVTGGQYSGSTFSSIFHMGSQAFGIQKWSTYTLAVQGTKVPDDGYMRGKLTAGRTGLSLKEFYNGLSDYRSNGSSALLMLNVSVTVLTKEKEFFLDVSTPSLCPNNVGGKLIETVCSVPGGDKQIVVDGVTHTVHSDCWQYTDTYLSSEETQGTCGSLINDAACTRSLETCTETIEGECAHKQYTYQCQKVFSSQGLLCGGEYFCKSGSCSDTDGAGDSGFDVAVAKLAGLASAAEDIKNSQDPIDVRAFTGEAMSCRKAFAGFSNCCKDSGWGQDTGLAACSSEELAVGKAKAKKVTVSVGERCDHKVLGACIQKSQVYCVFGGKLARIIQEQGRRDQLGVSFGSGDEPDCRGISVPELQGINFDLVNFSDFYQDLMDNQKIPESGVMVKQIKDRIASQVQQQTQKSSGAGK